LHFGSIVQLKTVIDQCDITFCTVGVDRHPTLIAGINGHHIAPLRIKIKQKNDDWSPGVCPDFPCDFCTADISAALRVGKFKMDQVSLTDIAKNTPLAQMIINETGW
jgi:hypothetical protein